MRPHVNETHISGTGGSTVKYKITGLIYLLKRRQIHVKYCMYDCLIQYTGQKYGSIRRSKSEPLNSENDDLTTCQNIRHQINGK